MKYLNYERDIVLLHGVTLEGWTHSEWKNPSELGTSLQPLYELHDAFKNRTCRFVKLTATEQAARQLEYNIQVANGGIVPRERKKRKDVGKARGPRRKRQHLHTRESEGEDDSASSDNEGGAAPATGTLQQFSQCAFHVHKVLLTLLGPDDTRHHSVARTSTGLTPTGPSAAPAHPTTLAMPTPGQIPPFIAAPIAGPSRQPSVIPPWVPPSMQIGMAPTTSLSALTRVQIAPSPTRHVSSAGPSGQRPLAPPSVAPTVSPSITVSAGPVLPVPHTLPQAPSVTVLANPIPPVSPPLIALTTAIPVVHFVDPVMTVALTGRAEHAERLPNHPGPSAQGEAPTSTALPLVNAPSCIPSLTDPPSRSSLVDPSSAPPSMANDSATACITASAADPESVAGTDPVPVTDAAAAHIPLTAAAKTRRVNLIVRPLTATRVNDSGGLDVGVSDAIADLDAWQGGID